MSVAAANAATTARDLVTALRRHYIPDETRPGGIFAAEIQAPGSTRRADAIWQGVTASSGLTLIGHEVKVTRADVLVELADPTKADAWLRYCDRWWLVVAHPSLVEGLDLPDTWGVLAPPSGRRRRSFTIVHPAPRLRPAEKGPALRTLATRLHWDGHRKAGELTRARGDIERLQAENRRLEQQVPHGERSRSAERRHDVIARIVDELGGPWGEDTIGTWDCQVDVAQVVAALRDLGQLRRAADDTRQAVQTGRATARRHIEFLQRVVDTPLPKESACSP